ncbi:MAG: DNRLRE domain-containing protein [Myxococcota bacterium]
MTTMRTLAALSLSAALLATTASAETFLLRPGFEGQDTAYYSFIPLLVRGQYSTMYVQTATDEEGETHSMETYLRFDLPEDLLGPGETVTEAYLRMVYAFSFDHFGEPPDTAAKAFLQPVLEPWDEDSLHYANRPAYGATIAKIKKIKDFGALDFDVTETVREWAHGVTPNYGFALSNPTERPLGFHSWESGVDEGLKSALVIETGPGDPPGPARCKACGMQVSIATDDVLKLDDGLDAAAPASWTVTFEDGRFALDDGEGGMYSGSFSEGGSGRRKIELFLDSVSRAALLDTLGTRLSAAAGEELIVTETEPLTFVAKLNSKKTKALVKLVARIQTTRGETVVQGKFKVKKKGAWVETP